MVKQLDQIFCYRRGGKPYSDGFCRIRIFHSDKRYFLLTEVNGNPGSIINDFEFIQDSLFASQLITKEDIPISHLEKSVTGLPCFDFVTLRNGNLFWDSITKNELLDKLQCDDDEFDCPTTDIPRFTMLLSMLQESVEKHYPVQTGSTFWRKSRLNQFKKSLTDLVDAKSGEQELQKFLKKSDNIHCFSQYFASPNDEYIIFSEFPIGNRVVDFLILSSRSRMQVILVEIKGADFNLSNHSGRQCFKEPIDTAMKQILEHKRYVRENMLTFSEQLHKQAQQVFNGNNKYNAHLGPSGLLQVDPKKDVIYKYVIIGGSRVNDLLESKARHDWEEEHKDVSLHSWQSWLYLY